MKDRTVKSLYAVVNPRRQWRLICRLFHTSAVPNLTIVRRQNALILFHEYAEKAMASGLAPKGLEQSFAAVLQISPSMWSQIKSSRPIGDKLARQIEALCGRPAAWLDEHHASNALTPAEAAFLDLALSVWRSTNSPGRKTLRAQLKAMQADGD
jgi:hypothetical protein